MRPAVQVIAEVEGNGDDMYLTLPFGIDVAEAVLAALEAEGYSVMPFPKPTVEQPPRPW